MFIFRKTVRALAAAGVVAAGCAAGVQAAVPDGTHDGESMGRNGPVKVQVTTRDGKITQVRVVSHKESAGISDAAFERIPGDIVKHQTANVDVVSGASLSSAAIVNAVLAALKSTGADVSAFKSPSSISRSRTAPSRRSTRTFSSSVRATAASRPPSRLRSRARRSCSWKSAPPWAAFRPSITVGSLRPEHAISARS